VEELKTKLYTFGLRYFLKGPRKGESEVFVDGLPGLPDNIRPTGRGGYYIGLAIPRIPGVMLFS